MPGILLGMKGVVTGGERPPARINCVIISIVFYQDGISIYPCGSYKDWTAEITWKPYRTAF